MPSADDLSDGLGLALDQPPANGASGPEFCCEHRASPRGIGAKVRTRPNPETRHVRTDTAAALAAGRSTGNLATIRMRHLARCGRPCAKFVNTRPAERYARVRRFGTHRRIAFLVLGRHNRGANGPAPLTYRSSREAPMPIDWGGSELGECWSIVSIRISGCTRRQFSVFQTPVGRCHSNGATFRCALYLLDLLSSRSCPTRNEIELDLTTV
jgi:hypothetical protein